MSIHITLTVISLLVTKCISEGTTPDQVHISFTGDMTEMAVVWNTFSEVSQDVTYGKTGSGATSTAKGSSEAWVFGGITRYRHKAIMTGLEYSTEYDYTIASRKFSFKTLSNDPQSYKVCVFGDLGYWHGNSTESIIKHGLAGDFDFIVHLGDIAYDLHTNNGQVGDSYLNVFEPLISKVPYMVIAGNHEDDYQNFTNYQKRFSVPDNGHNDNQFYSFDLGPVHWVGVSTETYGYYYEYGMDPVMTQYDWLKRDLTTANSNRAAHPWIFTFQHRPFYCSNVNSAECQSFENRLVRTGWLDMPGLEPLFLQTSVDFGFWGHEHSYERFYPVADRAYWNDPNAYINPKAPVYLISGSAGCHTPDALFTDKPWPWSAARNNDYGWSIVTVANRTHIRVEQISIDKNEQTVDDFWVIKDEGHMHSGEMRRANPGAKFPLQKCHFKDVACKRSLKEINEEL
ncbi:Purple acid phosphatase [Caenorhabditis elegans]|uniref:Purple acid phosphatase n=2 Tax=Caenorhabditis elegans TaxID=6239 RepID=Q19553_CAEEL|nr:Purple acid phosphatase [Caenorhabditis elegans]CAA99834.1 Purple acid phosphatase [Caenorhabditis elegans]|eukprot:NP_001256452.1 Purple acid phosphatase [Caenorhabditis elegans]